MPMTNVVIMVLAGGRGTRMRSRFPKVLHKAAGRTLLGHVLAAGSAVAPKRTVVVAGTEMPEVAVEARRWLPDSQVAVQESALGTGNAVSSALPALHDF